MLKNWKKCQIKRKQVTMVGGDQHCENLIGSVRRALRFAGKLGQSGARMQGLHWDSVCVYLIQWNTRSRWEKPTKKQSCGRGTGARRPCKRHGGLRGTKNHGLDTKNIKKHQKTSKNKNKESNSQKRPTYTVLASPHSNQQQQQKQMARHNHSKSIHRTIRLSLTLNPALPPEQTRHMPHSGKQQTNINDTCWINIRGSEGGGVPTLQNKKTRISKTTKHKTQDCVQNRII